MRVWKNGGKISCPQAAFDEQRCDKRTDNLHMHNSAQFCINKGRTVRLKVNEEELEWIPRKKKKLSFEGPHPGGD